MNKYTNKDRKEKKEIKKKMKRKTHRTVGFEIKNTSIL
jgi:hypothetical protein